MNISKQYAWRSAENSRENNPLLPQSLRGLVIGKSGCGKTTVIFNLLLQPGWLDYNHLYVFGKSLHQQENKVLRKGFEAGLSTQQIPNGFNSQEALGDIPPLIAIETYSGARNGKIRVDFYEYTRSISIGPCTTEFVAVGQLGKQNKAEAYYTRGRHNCYTRGRHNCDTIYIAQNYFRLPWQTIRENSNFIIIFLQDAKNLTHIHADHCANDISVLECKQFCYAVWSKGHNFVTINLTSTPTNGKYRFYFPTGTI